MSTAFTSPAHQSWQTLLDELTLAYSERRQSIGQSVYTPTDGKDVHSVDYWSTLQSWIETYCLSFIDHVSGPLNPAGSAFLPFVLETTFRSAAGLDGNGFRRATGFDPDVNDWTDITTPDPMYTAGGGGGFGLIEEGDVIGPWILDDLQKSFSALRWSMNHDPLTSISDSTRDASSTGGGTCDEELTAFHSAWASSSWNSFSGNRIVYSAMINQSDPAFWNARRYCGSDNLTIPTIPRTLLIYFLPTISPAESSSASFLDIDGLGVTENIFWLYDTIAESSAESFNTGVLFKNDADPVTLSGWTCPAQNRRASVGFDAAYWLLKWNFTNA